MTEAWLARSLPEAKVPVHGAVLFTDADRLTVRDCSQPVFQGALPLAVHLRTTKTEQPVPEGLREAIAQRICTSPELPGEPPGPGRP